MSLRPNNYNHDHDVTNVWTSWERFVSAADV